MRLLIYISFFFCLTASAQTATGIVVTVGGNVAQVNAAGKTTLVNLPPVSLEDTTLITNDIKADFERLTNITVIGNTATANRAFTQADVGKVLVIKQARSYPLYVTAAITLNAAVTNVNAGAATFSAFDTYGSAVNVTGATGFIATDNWQTLESAKTDCYEFGKKRLLLNYTGTAYMVPQRHGGALFAANRYGNIITSDITIDGLSKATVLKYGMEDLMQTDHSTEPSYVAFAVYNCKLRVNNLTLESADRISTENDVQNCMAFYFEPVAGNDTSKQSLICTNVDILNGEGKFWQGWSAAYMNNSSFVKGQQLMSFTNSTMQVQAGPAFFNSQTGNGKKDSAFRSIRLINCNVSAGAKYAWESLSNLKVTDNSDTIEVMDAGWSWYDRNYYLRIGTNIQEAYFTLVNLPVPNTNPYNGPTLGPTALPGNPQLDSTQALFCKMIKIISPTKCVIQVGGASTGLPNTNWQKPVFSSTTCNLFTCADNNQFRPAAFHGMYVSGNVGAVRTNVVFRVLRFQLNRQNSYQPISENSTTNVTCIQDISFPAAEKNRSLVQGSGFGAGPGSAIGCETF